MKKLLTTLLALVAIAMTAGAQTKEAYAVVSTDGTTLTFYYDTQKAAREGTEGTTYPIPSGGGTPGWVANHRETILTADFDESFSQYQGLTSTIYMFYALEALTTIGHLDRLNTANVTNMSFMFFRCVALKSLDVSHFNTAKVTNMSNMFYYCQALTTLDVKNFDTKNVTNMNAMFGWCTSLTSLDLSGFNMGKVTDMSYMFYNCQALATLNLSGFNTAHVTDMSYMFASCSALTSLDLSSFDTSNVKNMGYMFNSCSKLTDLDVSNFNTANVTDMSRMFCQCSQLTTLDLNSFNTENVTNMYWMFWGSSNLKTIYCDKNWNTGNVTNSSEMFNGCSKLVGAISYNGSNANDITYANPNTGYFTDPSQPKEAYAVVSTDGKTLTFYYDAKKAAHEGTTYAIPSGGTPGWSANHSETIITADFDESFSLYDGLTSTSDMFYRLEALTTIGHLDRLNTANVTNMNDMFFRCEALVSLDVSHFNTANVTDMGNMFYGCQSLTTLDVKNFDTKNVTNMNAMFGWCTSLTSLDLSNFKTEKVTDMSWMFYSCPLLATLNLSSFNTAQVTNMSHMFASCSALASLDLSSFDTSNVKNMGYMFNSCSKLTDLDVSNFNTANVTDMSWMFRQCDQLTTLDLNSFNTEKVANMSEMFRSAYNLTTIYCSKDWNMGNVTNSTEMFTMCRKLVGAVSYSNSNANDIKFANPNTGYFTDPSKPKEAYAVLDGSALTFYYDQKKAGRAGTKYEVSWDVYDYPGWANNGEGNDAITTVDFDESFADYDGLTNATYMFYNLKNLTTINHLDRLNTANVTNMYGMFWNCEALQGLNLSGFNTEKVTNMSYMFYACNALTSLDVSNFGTKNVTNMYAMFGWCKQLERLDLSNFNTANVINMGEMFIDCKVLATLNLSGFNTANVTNMSKMFSDCEALTSLDLSSFDTSNVTDMSWMFYSCHQLTTLDLLNFDTKNVTNMNSMFRGSSNLKTIYCDDDWSKGKVNNSEGMFNDCYNLKGAIEYNVYTNDVSFANPATGYFTGRVAYACWNDDASLTFYYDRNKLKREGEVFEIGHNDEWKDALVVGTVIVDQSMADYHGLTSTNGMFAYLWDVTEIVGIEYLNTENVTDMSGMFLECYELASVDLSHFNTSKVTKMEGMFNSCYALQSLDLSNFDTRQVTKMSGMFWECNSLTSLDLTNFDTRNVTDMPGMFYNCNNLTTIYCNYDWAKEGLTDMEMFNGCQKLVGAVAFTDSWFDDSSMANPYTGYFTATCALPYAVLSEDETTLTFYCDDQLYKREGSVYGLNKVGAVTGWHDHYPTITQVVFDPTFADARPNNTFGWFADMSHLNDIIGIEYLNTSEVTNMAGMFSGVGLTTLDLSTFNMQKVKYTFMMFSSCEYLTTIYCNDDWSKGAVTQSENMFGSCSKLKGGNGTEFDVSYSDITYARPDEEGSPGYFTRKALRGDVNGDGKVDVADVTAQVNLMKNGSYSSAADIDGSGTLTEIDVTELVNIVLRK